MITEQLAKAKKAYYDYYSNILVAMKLLNISPKKKKKKEKQQIRETETLEAQQILK